MQAREITILTVEDVSRLMKIGRRGCMNSNTRAIMDMLCMTIS